MEEACEPEMVGKRRLPEESSTLTEFWKMMRNSWILKKSRGVKKKEKYMQRQRNSMSDYGQPKTIILNICITFSGIVWMNLNQFPHRRRKEALTLKLPPKYSPLCSFDCGLFPKNIMIQKSREAKQHLKHSFSWSWRWTSLEKPIALNLYPNCSCTPFPLKPFHLPLWTYQLHQSQEVGMAKLSMTGENSVF